MITLQAETVSAALVQLGFRDRSSDWVCLKPRRDRDYGRLATPGWIVSIPNAEVEFLCETDAEVIALLTDHLSIVRKLQMEQNASNLTHIPPTAVHPDET